MKRMLKQMTRFLFISMGLLFAGCSNEQTGESKAGDSGEGQRKIQVVTTIAQISEPLAVIGGDKVEVVSLMGPSVDPHLYNATHSDIEKIEKAELVFYNGLNLEANMVEIFEEIGKTKPVLAVAETIPEDQLLYDEEGAVDPHIWFDIDLWRLAIEAAVDELSEYAPEQKEFFEENKNAYFNELSELKTEAEKLLNIPEEQRVLVTAHDAFGYFGRAYDMEVIGLQGLSTESEIGISDIQETIDLIMDYKVPAVFVETSINEDSIKAVIEGAQSKGLDLQLGGELFSDAMGEKGTEEGTYIGMYRHNVNTIYDALTGGGK